MIADHISKPNILVLYTEKYIVASHSNLKIADSLFIDRETETGDLSEGFISTADLKIRLKFPDRALCYN